MRQAIAMFLTVLAVSSVFVMAVDYFSDDDSIPPLPSSRFP